MTPHPDGEKGTRMRVLNKYKDTIPPGAIYVGRPSIYGNPFVIPRDGTRADVIAKFRSYLLANQKLVAQVKENLRGHNLVCFCAPLPCHADVLMEVANE